MVEVNILGPLEVVDDGTSIQIGPLKRRVVLGLLAAEAGRPVSTDRLIDALWDDSPPSSALATLQGLVYQLRQLLGADVIVSRPPGYVLSASVSTDVRMMTTLSGSASVEDVDRAVSLFRGRPLDDLGDGAIVTACRQRLADQRLHVVERWCDVAAEHGRAREVVDLLEQELTTSPWRESLWERLALALYRSNRQADALHVFGRARHAVGEDLGLELGPSMRRLEQQILLHDPSLSISHAQTGPASDLPAGTVTFMLSDVVGSTRMWEQSPGLMDDALARHEGIIASAVSANGGVLIKAKGEGDSTFSVFREASAGLAAALAAQRALIGEDWPAETPITVRIALHAGEAIERNGDYFGPTVNRAARLRSIAGGQEILVSGAAAALCDGDLPAGVSLADLGVRLLRDVSEHVLVVRHPALPVRVDAVQTSATRRVALPRPGTRFVGRAGELTHLTQRLVRGDGAVDGFGSMTMVIGEPGIGKTRLVSELAEAFVSREHVVLWGRSPDGDWAPPYAPFVEALERYLAGLDPDQARRLLSSVAAPLANVLPIVVELFPGVAAPASNDASERRFEILDALSRLIQAIASSEPVLFVLDDLHWVDHASAAALSFLVPLTTKAPVHIVGTYRDTEVDDGHPLSRVLESAQREARVDRVRLRGMSVASGRELILQLTDERPSDEVVDALMAASGGNPFFLGELARFHGQNTGAKIPDSVNDTIRQRLVRLTANANALLRIGALFDERFPLETTRLVADLGEDAALDAIDEAIAAHLIEPTDDLDEYRFVHALARVATQTTVNPSRLPRLHRRIATVLEEQDDMRDPATMARIATHYHLSRDLPGAHRGVGPALTAAAHADAVAAHSECATLLEYALGLMPSGDERRLDTMVARALALVRSSRPDDAGQPVLDVANLLAISKGGQAACEFIAAVTTEWDLSGARLDDPDWLRRWENRGIELAEDKGSAAYESLYTFSIGGQIAVLREDRYLDRAVLWRDPAYVEIGARTLRGESTAAYRWAVAAAARHRDELAALEISSDLTQQWLTGDYQRILPASVSVVTSAKARGQTGAVVRAYAHAAQAAACLGEFGLAVAHRDSAIAAVEASADLSFLHTSAIAAFTIATLTDRPWNEYKDLVDSVTGEEPEAFAAWQAGQHDLGFPSVVAMAMVMHARMNELDRAVRAARSQRDFLERADVHEYYYSLVAHSCAEVAWMAADSVLAAELEPVVRDRWLPVDFRNYATDVRLSLARLCAVQGRVDEATAWFAQARSVFTEQRALPLLAIADHDEALMNVRQLGNVRSDFVQELLGRARSQFEQLGMSGWLVRADALLESASALR